MTRINTIEIVSNPGPRTMIRGLGLFLCMLIVGVFGCSKPPEVKLASAEIDPPTIATTRPTTRPSQPIKPPLPPLPAKVLIKLDELKPFIPKPVNPPQRKKLIPRVEKLVSEAEVLISRRQYRKAIETLTRAVGFASDNPRIRRAMGIAYAGSGNPGKAIKNLRMALKISPDSFEAQVILGRLAHGRQQYTTAITAYRTALKCSQAKDDNPLFGESLSRLGLILLRKGYCTAALTCFTRLEKNIERHGRKYTSNPFVRGLVLYPERLMAMRGSLLLKLRKPLQAGELLQRAYSRQRTHSQIVRLLMKALLEANKISRAKKLFNEISAEPALKNLLSRLAGSLCKAAGDKTLPKKLWQAQKARRKTTAPLAIALASAAVQLNADDDAVYILESAIADNPGNIQVAMRLADQYASGGQFAKTVRLLGKLLADNPNADQSVGAVLRQLSVKPLPAAFERNLADKLKAGKSSNKHRYSTLYVAGRLAQMRGKKSLAARLFSRSLLDRRDFLPTFFALADIYTAQGRYDQIEMLLDRFAGEDKKSPLIPFLRGKVSLARGRPVTAARNLEQACKRNSKNVESWLLLAEAYLRMGNQSQVKTTLEQAMRHFPKHVVINRKLFLCLLEVWNIHKAKRFAGRTFQRFPKRIDGRLMLAEIALKEKKLAKARKLLKQLQKQATENIDVHLLAIRIEMLSASAMSPKDHQSRIKRLREILRKRPDSVLATGMMVKVLTDGGHADEADELWAMLYRKRPGDRKVAIKYLIILEKAKKYSQAANVLRNIVNDDPENVHFRKMLADMLLMDKKYPQAAIHAEKALENTLDMTSANSSRYQLLNIYTKGKMFDKAQKLLDDWILTSGDEATLISLRVQKIFMYRDADQIDRAEKYALGWISQSPKSVISREVLIDVLAGAEKYARCHELVNAWLKNAQAKAKKIPAGQPLPELVRWIYIKKIMLPMRQKKYSAALKEAEKTEKLLPKDTTLLIMKSTCLDQLGKKQQALAVLERAYKIDPDNPALNNNLGYMYADMGIRLDQAERMIRKALLGNPHAPFIQDSLAWVFYKQGKFAAARMVFDKMLKYPKSANPVSLDHIGDVYYRLGEKEKAVAFWTRAIEETKKEKKSYMTDIRKILKQTTKKIEAVRNNKKPPLAPLGKGVKDNLNPQPETK